MLTRPVGWAGRNFSGWPVLRLFLSQWADAASATSPALAAAVASVAKARSRSKCSPSSVGEKAPWLRRSLPPRARIAHGPWLLRRAGDQASRCRCSSVSGRLALAGAAPPRAMRSGSIRSRPRSRGTAASGSRRSTPVFRTSWSAEPEGRRVTSPGHRASRETPPLPSRGAGQHGSARTRRVVTPALPLGGPAAELRGQAKSSPVATACPRPVSRQAGHTVRLEASSASPLVHALESLPA